MSLKTYVRMLYSISVSSCSFLNKMRGRFDCWFKKKFRCLKSEICFFILHYCNINMFIYSFMLSSKYKPEHLVKADFT